MHALVVLRVSWRARVAQLSALFTCWGRHVLRMYTRRRAACRPERTLRHARRSEARRAAAIDDAMAVGCRREGGRRGARAPRPVARRTSPRTPARVPSAAQTAHRGARDERALSERRRASTMEYQHQPIPPLGPPAPPPQLLPPAPPPPLPSLPQLQHGHTHVHSQEDDRWSQYHIWRQHVFVNGKSVNNKDALEDKKDDSDLWETQAAFLGPNLWDKTLPYDPDLKYVDLDEFLSENGMPGEALGGAHLGGSAFGPALGLQAPVTKRERSPSPSDCMSPDTINPPLSPADSTFSMASSGRDFDPRTRAFSDEELKPQPMIKKSRKQFVPDDLKDDKYWARRRKNNMAAKRSRDARRMKENQIALRAGYLEKENMGLRQEVELLKKENHILREKLSKFADV